MEYYAKSKRKILSLEEVNAIKNTLQDMLSDFKEDLTNSEIKIIVNSIESLQENLQEVQKTLKEHEEDIIRCAKTFFIQYGRYFTEKEQDLVIEACRMHDWGKANKIFQRVVNPDLKTYKETQVPHGFLSGVTISKSEFKNLNESFTDEDFRAFITAIYYHHDRKDDYTGKEIREYGEKYYLDEISNYLGKKIKKLYCANINNDKILFRNNLYTQKFSVDSDLWNTYLVIKGLLNKFDYTVSAGYEESEVAVDLNDKKLKKNIESFLQGKDLRPAQQFMLEHKDENLIIVAPTGSGKTEASLLWLNGEKGFYTLPLKVSSNAIYTRIRNKYLYKDVALLHSDSMARYLKESDDDNTEINERYDRARMLAEPLTVCTVDQLFKFVYRALGTEIFAATLKYSKIILDEIQSYEPRVIATIIYGLKMIHGLGGKFAIITATFPPVLKYFLEESGLVEDKHYLFRDFTKKLNEHEDARHKIEIRDSEMDMDEILEQGMNKKVLVICNTVTKAQELYEELESQTESVWLLHSRYIRRDRATLEQKIMEFSESSEVGIWITTQIVEASLDIDFDVLYTEMCTADSLLQRMGRCNRMFRYFSEKANIIIYNNKNGRGKIYEDKLYDVSLKYLRDYENEIFTEELKTEYMNQVYNIEEIQNTDYFNQIKRYLKDFDEIHPAEYSKEEAKIRYIKSITIVPESIYIEKMDLFDKGIDFLTKSNINKEVRSLIRTKLEDFTLSLNFYKNFPSKVNKETIGMKNNRKIMNIHRAYYDYEFDLKSGRGRGLLINNDEESSAIFV